MNIIDTENIRDIFGLLPAAEPTAVIEVEAEIVPAPIPVVVPPSKVVHDLDEDFERARKTTAESIELVRSSLDAAAALALSGDNPIAFDAVSRMLTAIVQANKELLALHDAREKTTSAHKNRTNPSGDTGGNVTIEKAVFVGRASDLLKELKALRKTGAGEE